MLYNNCCYSLYALLIMVTISIISLIKIVLFFFLYHLMKWKLKKELLLLSRPLTLLDFIIIFIISYFFIIILTLTLLIFHSPFMTTFMLHLENLSYNWELLSSNLKVSSLVLAPNLIWENLFLIILFLVLLNFFKDIAKMLRIT